ncbi:Putative basic-leucine zipper domain superfamily [Colletotrichum destructivum]|uniref:Basic-leucine zipper domain superfamily n=1 Tax=Colletotrichum destructivum TaxID=34406 RepID=A0AAX4I240_9PEZI|nr:Putative basic-leucine zipper domain superfamily [Colletotrichum destructivum]
MEPIAGNQGRRAKRVRAVEALSEDQVQRKRNVDRMAQRAFRQRTKDRISDLEQQLEHAQEMSNLKDQRLSALCEHRNLLLQLLNNGAKGSGSNALHPPPSSSSSSGEALTDRQMDAGSSPSSPTTSGSSGDLANDPRIECTMWRGPVSHLSGPGGGADGDPPSPFPQTTRGHAAAHLVAPLHLPPTCPLDHILSDFVASRRAMLSRGAALEVVLGDPRPSVKALFDEASVASLHPLSALLSKVLATFPGLKTPERLAFFYVMSLTIKVNSSMGTSKEKQMHYGLYHSTETIIMLYQPGYDRQPGVRHVLVERSEQLSHPVFSPHFSSNVSVNWSFDVTDAVSIAGGETVLHSIFEKHVRNLKNWTMSPEFMARFPEMAASVVSLE